MAARIILIIVLIAGVIFAQPYPDQHYFHEKDSLIKRISVLNGIQVSSDGQSLILSEGITDGSAVFVPDSSKYPFNHGLPSWNGRVPNDNSSFKILIRFYKNGWSPWLTAGYWKANIWTDYGPVTFSGGKIDVDEAVLNSYYSKWQFQVVMKRTSALQPSPELHKLSLFVSDQQTTNNVNITNIVNDKPAAIFIPTEHFYQYAIDPEIGGSICSPTSVSMILRSYNIKVDPLQFARDNYDDYWGMFGVWPRVVQNAAQYGLNGAVTRYRSWSEARKVLAEGGRIAMSVGQPLYTGHLIMLAGFDSNGNPIVHDPAKSNGYSYKFDKTLLSRSWFEKGGVSYTFFMDSVATGVEANEQLMPESSIIAASYPNPFNQQTSIRIETARAGHAGIKVFDITGREILKIYDGNLERGVNIFRWNASDLPSGIYFIHVVSGGQFKIIKTLLLK